MKKEKNKTVILGASPNPGRVAYQAAIMLEKNGFDFVPVGIRKAHVLGKPIINIEQAAQLNNVDTITIYIRAELQPQWYNTILALHPKRIIFNPGAENPELEEIAGQAGIETLQACSLVMLSTGQY